MRPDLDNRQWEVPFNRSEAFNTDGGRRLSIAAQQGFVCEGYVMAKQLAQRGSGRPIPPGECAVTSLAAHGTSIFGGTSGRRAHIFTYDSRPSSESIMDILVLEGHEGVRRSLAVMPERGLFAGTCAPGRTGYKGGEVIRTGLNVCWGDVIQEWGAPSCRYDSLGIPVSGEGVARLIADPPRGMLYGLSDRTGKLFCVDAESGEIKVHGPVDEAGIFSPELILGPDGLVYACGTAGHFMCFDPDAGTLAGTDRHLPTMAGRGQYGRLGDWVVEPRSGLIYAGDVADGVLSTLDVRTMELRVLGKPTAQPHIRALAAGPDGRIYGVAGLRDTICHLFCCNPAAGEMRDLGVMAACVESHWYGCEFDCALSVPDGRICFGQTERVSCLFVYFPPPVALTGTQVFHIREPKAVGPTGSQL